MMNYTKKPELDTLFECLAKKSHIEKADIVEIYF